MAGESWRYDLYRFVEESNRIEGIHRAPTTEEMDVHKAFLEIQRVIVGDLAIFVQVCQPGAKLREHQGMDVIVGNHIPPPGGPDIHGRLENLLRTYVNDESLWELPQADRHRLAFKTHCLYETLHPFMDGNGRSGRVLWLWMMGGIQLVPLGFLHTFYYQSLANSR